jgi:catalase
MASERRESIGARVRPLSPGAALARLALIGVVLLVVAVAFAAVGGWLSPQRLTQDRMMAAFQEV